MRSVVAALLILAMSLVTAQAGSDLRVAPSGCLSANGAANDAAGACALIQSRAAPAAPETCKGGPALATLLTTSFPQPGRRSQPACPCPLSLPVTEARAESPWKPPPLRA